MSVENMTGTKPEPAEASTVRGFVDPAMRAIFYRAVATFLPPCDHDLLAAMTSVQTAIGAALDGDLSRKQPEKVLQRAVAATIEAFKPKPSEEMDFGFLPPLVTAGFGRITLAEHLALSSIRVINGQASPASAASLLDAADCVKEMLK